MSSLVRPLLAHAYTAAFARSTAEINTFSRETPERRRRLLGERLLSQVRYFSTRADTLPEWRAAARVSDPLELLRVWGELPIVTKEVLQDRFPPAGIAALSGLRGRIGATGGSTGEPTLFFHDSAMVRACRALDLHSRKRMGWRPGMPTVAVWGSDRDIRPGGSSLRKLAKTLRGDLFVDGYQLTEQTAKEAVELIRHHAPVAMFGFSSMLGYVAQKVIELGLHVPQDAVAVAWSGGEMLLDQHVRAFERAFGTPILNRYGGRELSTMACQYHANAALQVHRPWLMVEIVDDVGNPVEPGTAGRLLWTSTLCRGTPFLRYEIGDLGAYAANDRDEAGISALSALHGRQAGVIEINGKSINGLFWNHLLKEFDEVRQFQIVLTREGTLRLRFNGLGFSAEREAELRAILSRFLGTVDVTIEWGQRLMLTAQGKLMQVVKE
ncbi:MAG: CapK related-protein [Gemmatimonadetes bacterium]|nr:CapK related-protein [Gemmatimonadota bacterium]